MHRLLLALLLLALAMPLEGQAVPDSTIASMLALCDRLNDPDAASSCYSLMDNLRDTSDSDRNRFALFTECAPVGLYTSVVGGQAEAVGLTEDRVRTMAESRLRAAGLFSTSLLPHSVFVGVETLDDGSAFSYELSFPKRLRDPISGVLGIASTWAERNFGTHGGEAGFIMQALSEAMDRFILEYLRVNEEWCG